MSASLRLQTVTRLDKEVQELLVERIKSSYPEDLICAEEGCLRAAVGQGSVWVIDPIDGTNNFVAQQEDFAVMLAYFEDGVGKFGIIYDVMKGDCYHGGGAFPPCPIMSPYRLLERNLFKIFSCW